MRPILLLLVALATTDVRLVRTACYGVCPADELVIRTDGTATYSGMKSERAGDWRGTLSRADAQQLKRTIEALGFAKLDAEYGHWNIDSPDYIVTFKGKKVVSHMQQVPQLRPIITAILEASAKVKWSPEPSGIEGRLLRNGKPMGDSPFAVTGRRRTCHALSSHDGHFRIPLLPGEYTIEGVRVRVVARRYTHAEIASSRVIFRAPHV